jgi:Nucleotidyl transferase AbiEii toxin, Type IV TA system
MGKPLRAHPEVLVPDQHLVLTGTKPLAQKWRAYLAGGSALALQLGHRRSRDFDWFTKETLPPERLISDLKATGFSLAIRQNTVGTLHAHVGGIEYSVFRYRYDLVGPLVDFEGSNLASLPDICAMKLAAIHQRAMKRDYVDLHAVFHRGGFTLDRALEAWHQKFPQADPSFALNAMVYFKDVESQEMPEMLIPLSWEQVKRGLTYVREHGRARGLDR